MINGVSSTVTVVFWHSSATFDPTKYFWTSKYQAFARSFLIALLRTSLGPLSTRLLQVTSSANPTLKSKAQNVGASLLSAVQLAALASD